MKRTPKETMPAIGTLFCVFLLLMGGTAFPQARPAAPAPQSFISPEETTEDFVEVPKEMTDIEYKDGLLSVDLLNADFRRVLTIISQKAGFSIEGYSESFAKKVTTRFQNIELERAVTRLLTLVSEKNYLLNYNTVGAISSIELYGVAGPPKTTTKPTPTVRPTTTTRTPLPTASPRPPQPLPPPVPQAATPEAPVPADMPPPVSVEAPRPTAPVAPQTPVSRRMRYSRQPRPVTPQTPGTQQSPDTADAPPPPDTPDPLPGQQDEPAQEVPYIPQKAPVFVPSRSR